MSRHSAPYTVAAAPLVLACSALVQVVPALVAAAGRVREVILGRGRLERTPLVTR